MALRHRQRAHCRGEQQREDDEDGDGVEGGVLRPADARHLVHDYHWYHQQGEDDAGDDEANEILDARPGVVMDLFVCCLAQQVRRGEYFLQSAVQYRR